MHRPVGITVQSSFWIWAGEADIAVNLRHIMDFGKRRFEARILNGDSVVHSMRELPPVVVRYV